MSKLQIEFISNGYCSPGEDKVYHFFPITGTAGDVNNLHYFNTIYPDGKKNELQEAINSVSKVLRTWNAKIIARNEQDDNTAFCSTKVTVRVKEDDVVGEEVLSVPNLHSGKSAVIWKRTIVFTSQEEHSVELTVACTKNDVFENEEIENFSIKVIPLELLYQSILTIQKTLSNPTAAVLWQEFLYQNCTGNADDNIYVLDRKIQEFANIHMNKQGQ